MKKLADSELDESFLPFVVVLVSRTSLLNFHCSAASDMPRRPRPVTRKPPQTVLHNSGDVKQDASMAQKTKPHTNVKVIRKRELNDNSSTGEDVNDISHDSDEEPGDEDDEENASALEEPREQDIDVDAPRVAQWVGEDDFDSQVDSEESEEDSEEEGASDFEEGSSTGGNMVGFCIA